MDFWNRISQETHLLDFPSTPHGPIGLIYPNGYTIGMASLGFQQVYRLLKESGFSVERIFYDKKGRETKSVENQTPLFRFPVIASSYTYELDIIHLLQMMLRGGVDPLSKERGDASPIVIIGGQAATGNPRLLQELADIIYLGEGERILPRLGQILIENQGNPRGQILEAVSALPHVYVPTIHGEYNRTQHPPFLVEPIDEYPCHTVIRAQEDEFGGAFLLELSRGCKYRCKFCIVHYMNGTARYRDYDSLIEIVEKYQDRYQKVGLLGAAVADHPQVEEITEWLVNHGKQVSTSSLRAERITERFLDLLRNGGQHNITVAPEAGGLETRKSMLKGVRDDKYFRLAEWAGKRKFPSLKLYFLIGTPNTDPMDEATEIIRFSQQMSARFSRYGGGRITVAVSPFVPKPTTPWEGESMWQPAHIKKASRLIRKKLAFQGNMKVPPVNVKEARAEAILSWYGPELTDELIHLAKEESSLENAFKQVDMKEVTKRSQYLINVLKTNP